MAGIQALVAIADEYARAAGASETTVSWRVFGDTKKLAAIRAGADIQVGRFEKALTWFSENWPAGAEWPDCIDRPARSSQPEAVNQ